jgi:hypothetical protein
MSFYGRKISPRQAVKWSADVIPGQELANSSSLPVMAGHAQNRRELLLFGLLHLPDVYAGFNTYEIVIETFQLY